MSKTTLRSLLFALAGVLTLNLHAELTWTTGSSAPSAWTALADNLLAGQTGKIDGSIATGYSTNDPDLLTDGAVPTAGGKDWIVGFQSNASITWTFSAPKTLERLRVSSCYLADKNYSRITVGKVEVKAYGSDQWTDLGVSPGSSTASQNNDVLTLDLGDDTGSPVASSIIGLRVTFSQPPSGFANYCAEIEAVGYAEATGPVLEAFDVVPAKTKAMVFGSIADVGTDATACDVYLALDGAAAVKIAEGVTGPFEYQIQGLTAETTYAYELSVSNNAPTAKITTRSGEFTTLSADAQTASWTQGEYAPADWSALENNILSGLDASEKSGISSYASQDLKTLTDGKVPVPAAGSGTVGCQNNATIAWTLKEPMTIEKLRLSSLWESTAYNGISVNAIQVKYPDSTSWETLDLPTVQWTGGKELGQTETLSDAETGVLVRKAIGLKITFGAQKAAVANYYGEIEAVGHPSIDDPVPPEFNAPTVDIQSATRAAVSVSLSDLGGRATKASVFFAYGTSPDALGASECVSESASIGIVYGKELTGLTPETTYYYAFFATNDVTDAGVTVTGSFTMPEATTVNCELDIPVGVSVKVGDVTYTESATVALPKGDEVVFEAVPMTGYKFLYWEGSVARSKGMVNPLIFASEEACELRPIVAPDISPMTFTWKGGDGEWSDPAKWDVGGRVPTSGDTVVIESGTCAADWVYVGSIAISGTGKLCIGYEENDFVDEVGGVVSGNVMLSDSARLEVALPNGNRRGMLKIGGNLTLAGSSELHVAAGPIDGPEFTLAKGCGFVTVGGTFEIKDAAKFVPCCDQYTGGGVVTTADRFVLASGASVEAISLGYAWFADREPNSRALGSPTGEKGKNGWYGAGYGGQGDTYGGGTGIRGNGGIEPYGFANAPIHPGSHKYNDQQKTNDPRAGGGNVRIHAARVSLAGKIDVTTEKVVTSGAPSGGGIWITASKRLNVGSAVRLLAKGGDSQSFGNANGGGGRIAFGLRLTDEEIGVLAATGELPSGSPAVVGGEEEFFAAYPGCPETAISLEGGKANNDPTDKPLEVCHGTFRFLVGPKKPSGLMLLVR